MTIAVKDKLLLGRSIAPLLELPIKRIVIAHDQIIQDDAKIKFAAAFQWLL